MGFYSIPIVNVCNYTVLSYMECNKPLPDSKTKDDFIHPFSFS